MNNGKIKDVEIQKKIWNSYVERGYLQSVIDPNDFKGVKVDYIDKWSKYYVKNIIVKKFSPMSVCEIGSGAGRLTIFLSKYIPEVYGVDIANKLLEVAMNKDKRSKVKYILVDGINFPEELKNKNIDLFYTMWVLLSFSSDSALIKMLKSYVTNSKSSKYFVFFEQAALNTFIVNKNNTFYKKIRTVKDYKNIFKKSGLKLLEIKILSEKGYGRFYNLIFLNADNIPKWIKIFNRLFFFFDRKTVKREFKKDMFTDCVFICERNINENA